MTGEAPSTLQPSGVMTIACPAGLPISTTMLPSCEPMRRNTGSVGWSAAAPSRIVRQSESTPPVATIPVRL